MTVGEVLSHKKYGEHYHSLTIVAPEIGEKVAPGQFVNVRCGEGRANILRRPFSVYRVHKRGGWASTIEIVFDVAGPGTRFLSQQRGHSMLGLTGPLGRGFVLPKRRAHCLVVGGGIGAAPLFFLADELRNEGHRVDVILGARNGGLLLNQIDARRLASVCRVTTDDGSIGDEGRVTDILVETMEKCETEVVYACGPHPMLRAVSAICTEQGIPVQVAVEELMACGYGVCMTCVMPLKNPKKAKGEEEVVYARSCTEGPVFNGAQVVWENQTDVVGSDQSELTPAGVPTREVDGDGPSSEHPPPGN
ncbi:MAG: dihydroorotate dehydrogenase electron transfer subunit [Actinomycetota bacterium]|jgi:dihydroorotate dehydrogenase electron transfer subunit|nr:dihydroorotate dehydrogenase electron transfer subunit [Actinomycetota bacterium]